MFSFIINTLSTTIAHTTLWKTRAGRREFGLWTLITTIISAIGIWCILNASAYPELGNALTLTGIALHGVLLLVLPVTLSVSVRRFHDLGLPGWVSFLFLVPLACLLLLPLMLFKRSQPGINRWGE